MVHKKGTYEALVNLFLICTRNEERLVCTRFKNLAKEREIAKYCVRRVDSFETSSE